MTIRHQSQDAKHPYVSPTTPGLYITFRAYIIELVCLNVNKKIGPRFWSDPKYWGPKFRREIKGVDNVIKLLKTMDSITQTAFVQVVQQHNIKSLSYKTTVEKVARNIYKRKTFLEKQRAELILKIPQSEVDVKKNSTFIDTGDKSVLAKIRESENG